MRFECGYFTPKGIVPPGTYFSDWEKMGISIGQELGNPQTGSDYIVTNGEFLFSSPFTVNLNPVPEPATMLLLGTGLVGVVGAARRRKKKQV